jgi:hypothetical protein
VRLPRKPATDREDVRSKSFLDVHLLAGLDIGFPDGRLKRTSPWRGVRFVALRQGGVVGVGFDVAAILEPLLRRRFVFDEELKSCEASA